MSQLFSILTNAARGNIQENNKTIPSNLIRQSCPNRPNHLFVELNTPSESFE